eukprot:9464414-Alexandrium_andersonii.AAC.1
MEHTLSSWRQDLEARAPAPSGLVRDSGDAATATSSAEESARSESPAREVRLAELPADALAFSVEEFRQRLEEVCRMHLVGDCQAPEGECPFAHVREDELAELRRFMLQTRCTEPDTRTRANCLLWHSRGRKWHGDQAT